jgi:hypothetical protein
LRKLKEFDVFRMAFKRSGVRLPLAPPIKSPKYMHFICPP